MSVADILLRLDAIQTKYDKFDPDQNKPEKKEHKEPFENLFQRAEDDLEALLEKEREVQFEKNRAMIATLNAEIRKAKGGLKNDTLPQLEKLAMKRKKGTDKEEAKRLAKERLARIDELADRIDEVADGSNTMSLKQKKKSSNGSQSLRIESINPDDVRVDSTQYETTEESRAFRQEYEQRRDKQDIALAEISNGLSTLKTIGEEMGEELDRQQPLVDSIEDKVDNVQADLNNANTKLRDAVHKMRSSRNFCIDVTLIVILLGIGAYIYNVVAK
mmetsp:Transcript_13783/g.50184  ORF Transcript_13783/g.50184 Transcript_13783/m.50184 type:complete len:274 (-) Transcript_13783:188-1009(-)